MAVYFGKGETNAVAVREGWGWVKLDIWEGEVGGFEEGAEVRCFEIKLGGVGEVLDLAAAAGAEVGAWGALPGLRAELGAEWAWSFVGHVEEAQAREGVGFEEALLQELLLDLFDLDGVHLSAVGSEFAGRLFAEGYKFGFGGGR